MSAIYSQYEVELAASRHGSGVRAVSRAVFKTAKVKSHIAANQRRCLTGAL